MKSPDVKFPSGRHPWAIFLSTEIPGGKSSEEYCPVGEFPVGKCSALKYPTGECSDGKSPSAHFQGSFTRGKWQRSVPKGAVNYQKFTRAKKEKDYWMGVGLF